MGMVEDAIANVDKPEVQKLIRELSHYGLGVFMPHMHTDNGFEPLPSHMVQLEGDLKVSFVLDSDERLKGASPVGWVWDSERSRVATACFCTGAEHHPHWDRPRPR